MNLVQFPGPGFVDSRDAQEVVTRDGVAAPQPVTIDLVDGKLDRRAAVNEHIAKFGFAVRCFACISDLFDNPLDGAISLVADDEGMAWALLGQLRSYDILRRPVLAYAEQPAVSRVVRVIRAGAQDYLDWPNDSGRMVDSIIAAIEHARWHEVGTANAESSTSRRPSYSEIAAQLGLSCPEFEKLLRDLGLTGRLDVSGPDRPLDRAGLPGKGEPVQKRPSATPAEEPFRQDATRGSLRALSKREIEVLAEISTGKSSRGVAQTLNIKAHTVDVHRSNILRKLNSHTIAEALIVAIKNGWISGERTRQEPAR